MILPKPIEERKIETKYKLNINERNKVFELWNADVSAEAIAKQFDVTPPTIYRMVKTAYKNAEEYSVLPKPLEERKKKREKFSEEVKDQVCELYNQDKTTSEISKITNLPPYSVRYIISSRRSLSNVSSKVNEDTFIEYFLLNDDEHLYSRKEIQELYKKFKKTDSDYKDWINNLINKEEQIL